MFKRITAITIMITVLLSMALTAPRCFAAVPEDAIAYGKNAYKAFRSSCAKQTAATECKKLGGHLLIINSRDEQAFVSSHFTKGDYWLGMQSDPSGDWRWDDGYSAGNADFAEKHPGDNGALIMVPGGGWKTAPLTEGHYYICEWENGAASLSSAENKNAATEKTKVIEGIVVEVQGSSAAQKAGESVTEASTIVMTVPSFSGDSYYFGDDSLSGIEIAEGVFDYENSFRYQKTADNEIVIFSYVGVSEKAVIPSSIEELPVCYIAGRCFQGMTLSEVTIPPTVVLIDDEAFGNVSDSFVIYGQNGTEAQLFAKRMGYSFTKTTFDDELISQRAGMEYDDTANRNKQEKLRQSKIKAFIGMGVALVVVLIVIIIFAIGRSRVFDEMEEDRLRAQEIMRRSGSNGVGVINIPGDVIKAPKGEKNDMIINKDDKKDK